MGGYFVYLLLRQSHYIALAGWIEAHYGEGSWGRGQDVENTGKLSWMETLAMQTPGKACSAQIPVLSGVLPS